MNLLEAMSMYAMSDKERFECAYPEWQEKRPSSTFYADFSVADVYGVNAIKDTYKRAFDGWKTNVQMFTELVGMLNHKIWEWYQKNDDYARLYDRLWKEADEYGGNHFKGEELQHFTMVLD